MRKKSLLLQLMLDSYVRGKESTLCFCSRALRLCNIISKEEEEFLDEYIYDYPFLKQFGGDNTRICYWPILYSSTKDTIELENAPRALFLKHCIAYEKEKEIE